MGFQWKLSPILALVLMTCCTHAQPFDIDMEGWIRCVAAPYDKVDVDLHFYDRNGLAVRFEALGANDVVNNFCLAQGAGTSADPWTVSTEMDRNTEQENNPCGVQVITQGTSKKYRWVFRFYKTAPNQVYPGQAFRLTSECDPANATASGFVQTSIKYKVTIFSVAPLDPRSQTGDNSYATGTSIYSLGTFYPDGADTPASISNAEGYALKNCYSATNIEMTENTEQFIDAFGCPIKNSALKPENAYELITPSGSTPIQVRTAIKAIPIKGNKVVYIQCRVTTCDRPDHPRCVNPCDAHNAGASTVGSFDTNYPIQTFYNVQDVPYQDIFAAQQTDLTTPLDVTTTGSSVRLVYRGHPYGIGASDAIKSATGYYVSTCYVSKHKNYKDAVTILDQGCAIDNSMLNLTSGFTLNVGETNLDTNSLYVLTSGRSVVPDVPSGRLYGQCRPGICTRIDHNYCRNGRCGSTNNLEDYYDDLGYLPFEFYIQNPNDQAIQILLTDKDGNPIGADTVVRNGNGINFSMLFVPNGQGPGGNRFNGKAGAYARQCIATVTNGGQSSQYEVVNDNGCRNPNSPVAFSQECADQSDVPGTGPFLLNCGNIVTDVEGDVSIECQVGSCDSICTQRCGLSPNVITNDLPEDLAQGASFKAKATPIGNTAKRSEEIRTIIVATTILLSLVVVLGIWFIACMCLRWQKKRHNH